VVQRSQPRQIVHKTLSQKNPSQKRRTGAVAQGEAPEFKPQYHTHTHTHTHKEDLFWPKILEVSVHSQLAKLFLDLW
jgi:hypothetical protein